MKKLYFLDEEEKNRVLSLHESAMKKQYLLNEEDINSFEATLPQDTKAKFEKMKDSWQGIGTRKQTLVDALNSFTRNEYNLYNKYLALKKPEGITGISALINSELGSRDLEYVRKIAEVLKNKFGLIATYNISKKKTNSGIEYENFVENTFKITKGGTPAPAPVVATPVKDVKQQPTIQQRRQQVNQQTSNTTKEIQKLLGQPQTGNLDALYVERLIDLLKQ